MTDFASRPCLLDQPPVEWALEGLPTYRREQISRWVFQRHTASFSEMSDLPESLRAELSKRFDLIPLELVRIQGSQDTTRKLLWKLRKGDFVESVLIPASPALYGERADRFTLCVSSQVGCAYGCKFCASGLEGWKRNLSVGEIVAQILQTERATGERINNLVFMGMGEPLANYSNLMKAIEMINARWGLGIGARRITISTSGLVPRIRDLAEQPLQVRLAISLHGATDAVRSRIMPINRKYSIDQLLEACAYFRQRKKQMITFEYILIEKVNDTLSEASLLANYAKRLKAKINLIPYNYVDGLPWKRPTESHILAFQSVLKKAGVPSTVRLEKGHDINAACGQLRLRELKAIDEVELS